MLLRPEVAEEMNVEVRGKKGLTGIHEVKSV